MQRSHTVVRSSDGHKAKQKQNKEEIRWYAFRRNSCTSLLHVPRVCFKGRPQRESHHRSRSKFRHALRSFAHTWPCWPGMWDVTFRNRHYTRFSSCLFPIDEKTSRLTTLCPDLSSFIGIASPRSVDRSSSLRRRYLHLRHK